MQTGMETDLTLLGRALVALQILMGLSAAGMGWYLFRMAEAGRRAGQWPPPGTRMLRWREPMTGERVCAATNFMRFAAVVLAAAGGYLVYLAFRFARLFGLW
jgi:hypothetical protein